MDGKESGLQNLLGGSYTIARYKWGRSALGRFHGALIILLYVLGPISSRDDYPSTLYIPHTSNSLRFGTTFVACVVLISRNHNGIQHRIDKKAWYRRYVSIYSNSAIPFLTRTVPIVQGGMQWVAYAELAAAVSNAGGLGIVRFLTHHESSKRSNLTYVKFSSQP